MASIVKRGDSYAIRVLRGIDSNGKRINANMTWKPDTPMSENRARAEAYRVAAEFEKKILNGSTIDIGITFEKYVTEIWLPKVKKEIKSTTYKRYEGMCKRMFPSFGFVKLTRIHPPIIRSFLDDLAEEKRIDTKYTPNFKAIEIAYKANKMQFAKKCGLSASTIAGIANGNKVYEKSATRFAMACGKKVNKLFDREEIPLSDTTILHHFRALSTILTSAVYDGIINDNPCKRVKAPRVKNIKRYYLDDEQAQQLIDMVAEKAPHPFDMIIIMLLHTGMRRGECCGLSWDDIDFDNCTININSALLYLPGQGIFEDTPKNETSIRVIKVGKSLIDMLRDYREWQKNEAKTLGDKWENSGRVFTSGTGGMINPGTVTSWFHRFVLENDLPYISIHGLRHTNATMMISSGIPITTAAKRLGHSTPSTTTKVYAHTIASLDARTAEYIDGIIPAPKFNPT